MAAPTFVAEYESAWNNSDPITRSVTVAAGDLLVLYGGIHNGGGVLATPSGGGLSWTLLQTSNPSSSYCTAQVWWAVSATSQTFDISVAKAVTGNQLLGFNVLRFSGASGVGASTKSNASSAAPSAFLTTTAANSAIVMFNTDWNGRTGARTYRAAAGAFTELSYYQASAWMLSGGYYADAGAAGSKQIGLTAPTSQKYNLVAVEVLGATAVEPSTGAAAGALSLAGAAAGARASAGAAAAPLTLSGAAVGARLSLGAAGVGLALAGSAAGARVSSGVASGGFGLSGVAVGGSLSGGSAAGSLGLSGAAAGARASRGAAAGALVLAGSAEGAAPSFVPTRDLRILNASVPVSGWVAGSPAASAWLAGSLMVRELTRGLPVSAWLASLEPGGVVAGPLSVSGLSGSGPVSGWGVSPPEV